MYSMWLQLNAECVIKANEINHAADATCNGLVSGERLEARFAFFGCHELFCPMGTLPPCSYHC